MKCRKKCTACDNSLPHNRHEKWLKEDILIVQDDSGKREFEIFRKDDGGYSVKGNILWSEWDAVYEQITAEDMGWA
jgi:hypothetical protein